MGQAPGEVALGRHQVARNAVEAQGMELAEHKDRRPFSVYHQYSTEKGRLPRGMSALVFYQASGLVED